MNIVKELTKDYGRAVIEFGEHSGEHMLEKLSKTGGCPFLSMAEGWLGIMRALEVRMGPLCRLDETFTLAAAKLVDGKPMMFYWVLKTGKQVK